MEFREHPGLYAIGEALDVDGRTGGYNLQFAYSSAAVCAEALTERIF
jgi:predicted flavoprotein YhiN